MSYELYTRGGQSGEKISLTCPKCGLSVEILWIPAKSQTYRQKGTTGGAEFVTSKTSDQVDGQCICGYKFKVADLDEESEDMEKDEIEE